MKRVALEITDKTSENMRSEAQDTHSSAEDITRFPLKTWQSDFPLIKREATKKIMSSKEFHTNYGDFIKSLGLTTREHLMYCHSKDPLTNELICTEGPAWIIHIAFKREEDLEVSISFGEYSYKMNDEPMRTFTQEIRFKNSIYKGRKTIPGRGTEISYDMDQRCYLFPENEKEFDILLKGLLRKIAKLNINRSELTDNDGKLGSFVEDPFDTYHYADEEYYWKEQRRVCPLKNTN